MIRIQGLQDSHSPELVSNLFQRSCIIELISAQRMRKLAKREPMYIAMVRTQNDDTVDIMKITNEAREQCTISVGDDKTKTPYPEQVQSILNDFSDIFPRDLPARLPLQ